MKRSDGQTILEFAFCMIIVLLLIYAAIMIFRWSGLDLAFRRSAHDHVLTDPIVEDWGSCLLYDVNGIICLKLSYFYDGPVRQIDDFFFKPLHMNAIWDGT